MFFEAFSCIKFWFCCWRSSITFVFSVDTYTFCSLLDIFMRQNWSFINIFIASILAFTLSVNFLTKSTPPLSSKNSDVYVSVRMGDRMGVSSGKTIFDERDISFGIVVSSFSTIQYDFVLLCGLFSRLLALIRSRSRSFNFFCC